MDQETKETIVAQYQNGMGIEALSTKYKVGKLKIKAVLAELGCPLKKRGGQNLNKAYVVEDHRIAKFVPQEGKTFIVKDKVDGTTFNDYENISGAMTSHLKKRDVDIPSQWLRNEYYKETGNYWFEQYFDYIEIDIVEKETKKCAYCDWTTVDIDNKSGMYKTHLIKDHDIKIEDHLIAHPEDKQFFSVDSNRMEFENDPSRWIICKECGKKLGYLTSTHLKFHNMTKQDYVKKYGGNAPRVSDEYKSFLREKMIETNKNMGDIPYFSSKIETEIDSFIKSLGFETRKDRQILGGKEIDILIEEKKVGFEINGCKWHTERFGKKDRSFHLNKTQVALKHGYRLIHIFEDEIVKHRELVEDKIKHILGVNSFEKKINARQCIIKEPNKTELIDFLETNHIQGYTQSSVALGAYYQEELVGVMTFKVEKKGGTDYDLTRFATKLDYLCRGLASKLLTHFIREYKPSKITSFADARWTLDETKTMYITIGFTYVGTTKPDYRYYNEDVDKYYRFHKFGFRKQILHKKFDLPLEMSESEMAEDLGFDKVWDCGLHKYELILS